MYQCAIVLSLTFLDARRSSCTEDRKTLQETIQSILGILHEAPLNKTMNRLVQITDDFAGIVRAIGSDIERSGAHDALERPEVPQESVQNAVSEAAIGHRMGIGTAEGEAECSGNYSENLEASHGVPLGFEEHGGDLSGLQFAGSSIGWNFEDAEVVESLVNGEFPQFYAFGGLWTGSRDL